MSTAVQGQQQPGSTRGRWGLVAAALLLQFAIGAVYAWSVFSSALQTAEPFMLSKARASVPFEVTIGMIFIGTYVGGRIQDRRGPRLVALVGGVLYGLGILLASTVRSKDDFVTLVIGYGVISGFGLGLAYIVPIAMLQKWFPDKRGLITGLAVGGFGFGAALTAPLAKSLISNDPSVPTKVFLPLGIAYLVMAVAGASFFKNPPAGYTVPGWTAPTGAGAGAAQYTQGEALRTPQWYLLAAILTLNVTAGIALISQAAGSFTEIAGYSATAAASAVGVLAFFNGGGRIFFAAVSDKIGRMPAFIAMLALQGVCFLALPHTGNPALFFVLAAIIYLCYGGGFGTMPATAGDFFGVKNAGAIYGLMIIGWSLGGVVGPLIAAKLIGEDKDYTRGYTTIAIIALVSAALPFITRPPRVRTEAGLPGAAASQGTAGAPRAGAARASPPRPSGCRARRRGPARGRRARGDRAGRPGPHLLDRADARVAASGGHRHPGQPAAHPCARRVGAARSGGRARRDSASAADGPARRRARRGRRRAGRAADGVAAARAARGRPRRERLRA
jgi:MFS transporter, OFA family, oxalate/formate antiporter